MSKHLLTFPLAQDTIERVLCRRHLDERLAAVPLRAEDGERVLDADDDATCVDCGAIVEAKNRAVRAEMMRLGRHVMAGKVPPFGKGEP